MRRVVVIMFASPLQSLVWVTWSSAQLSRNMFGISSPALWMPSAAAAEFYLFGNEKHTTLNSLKRLHTTTTSSKRTFRWMVIEWWRETFWWTQIRKGFKNGHCEVALRGDFMGRKRGNQFDGLGIRMKFKRIKERLRCRISMERMKTIKQKGKQLEVWRFPPRLSLAYWRYPAVFFYCFSVWSWFLEVQLFYGDCN